MKDKDIFKNFDLNNDGKTDSFEERMAAEVAVTFVSNKKFGTTDLSKLSQSQRDEVFKESPIDPKAFGF